MRNRKTATRISYRALKAVEGDNVGSGAHLTRSVTVGYDTDESILGYTIGSASVSYQVSDTLDGPTRADRIGDHYATHRWGFGVLYGSIAEVSYDLYDVRTETLVAHHSMNTVVSPRGAAQNFMFSLTGKDGVYVLQANGDEVFWFDSIPGAVNAICESPADYI